MRDFCSSLHTVGNIKHLEDMAQVILNSKHAYIQNARNFEICFAHFHPVHNLYFTLAQAVVFACVRLICKWRLIGLGGLRVRKGCNPAKRRVEIRQQDLHRTQRFMQLSFRS